MNKLSFICLISLITAIYACSRSIVPVKYQARRGIESTTKSTVSCETDEILVSCGIKGRHALQGTHIDPTDQNTCVARSSSSDSSVTAVAICGKFPEGVIKQVHTIISESQLDTQVVTQCPPNTTLTGCQVNYQSGPINNLRGSYPGPQQGTNKPPAQISTDGLDTMDQCIAEARSDSTKIRGGVQCLETTSKYTLGKYFDLR